MTREERELVSERELVELFRRRRRPEPETFRAGVERRIVEKQREAERRAEEERRAPLKAQILRRVAAVFPTDPLGGAAIGGATAKVVGVKLLPAVLALPALLLASVAGTFAMGARSLIRSIRGADLVQDQQAEPHPDVRLGRSFSALGGFALMILSPLLGARMVDALVLAVLVSMVALVITFRGLARSGWLTRPKVAQVCEQFLSLFFCFFLITEGTHVEDPSSELGVQWGALALVLGFAVCEFAARWRERRPWVHVGRGALFLFVVVAINPIDATRSSPADLRRWVERFDPDTEIRALPSVAATVEALRAVHAEPPDLSSLKRHFSGKVDWYEGAISAAVRMDLLDANQWRDLAERSARQVDDLLAGGGQIYSYNDLDLQEYLFHLVAHARTPIPAQLDQLTARIDTSWPPPDEYKALQEAAYCAKLLDLFGRPDLVDAHRDDAYELLRHCWVHVSGFHVDSGFSSDPKELPFSSDDSTLAAIELIGRLGAPADIDLRLLRSHLRGQCHEPFQLLFGSSRHALDRASLMLLEYKIGLPSRTWLEALLGERLLIASSLIVVLCLVAIRLTPPAIVESAGAQP